MSTRRDARRGAYLDCARRHFELCSEFFAQDGVGLCVLAEDLFQDLELVPRGPFAVLYFVGDVGEESPEIDRGGVDSGGHQGRNASSRIPWLGKNTWVHLEDRGVVGVESSDEERGKGRGKWRVPGLSRVQLIRSTRSFIHTGPERYLSIFFLGKVFDPDHRRVGLAVISQRGQRSTESPYASPPKPRQGLNSQPCALLPGRRIPAASISFVYLISFLRVFSRASQHSDNQHPFCDAITVPHTPGIRPTIAAQTTHRTSTQDASITRHM